MKMNANIRSDEEGTTIRLTDNEFDKAFPEYREMQKWNDLAEEEVWEIYLPHNDDAECSLCVITGNQSSDSWVLDYGKGQKDILIALTNAGILPSLESI